MSEATAPGPDRPRERGNAERLREAFAREVRSGRWQEGEKLPTERELGVQYGVARNTVRRALQALEADALVVRQVGRGTFRAVASGPPDPFDLSPDALSPSDVVECRLIFEPELAALVVGRATTADFERMEQCVRGADEAPDAAGFEHWDAKLHDTVATATRNHTVIAMARALARVRLNAEWGKLKARGMTADRKRDLQTQHRAIIEAFRQRDREEARALLRTHILYVRSYMFGE